MPEYLNSVDIGNRALDHVGQAHIAALSDGTSKASDLIGSIYDKVRRAELQRNVWRFSIREVALRAINTTGVSVFASSPAPMGAPTMQIVPAAWNVAKTYLTGSIVSFGGAFWTALQNVPVAQEPDTASAYWDVYFGSMVAVPYDTSGSTVYFGGEIVYTLAGVTPTVFMSMIEGNIDVNSSAPLATPDAPGTINAWNAITYYNQFDTVTGSDLSVYQSKIDLNINVNPVGDAGVHWQAVPGTQATSMAGPTWLKLDSTLVQIRLIYPIGAGPATQSTTRNIYQLPNGFLKRAPQDPKAGSQSYLGAPSGLNYDDWDLQGNYLISRDTSVVRLRFAADVVNVPSMTEMFCEGLACRVAEAICEPLTQSTEKLATIASAYKLFMGEARIANGIETGSYEPPVDDFIACRM